MTLSPNGSGVGRPSYATPPEVVAVARYLMGGIDLDPCTTAKVNSWFVQAPQIFEAAGLEQVWAGRVFCNPPGGQGSKAAAWWNRMAEDFLEERILDGFYVSFSLDRLQTSQACALPLTAFPTFVPDKRIAYVNDMTWVDKHGVPHVEGERDPQPPKPSCFTWLNGSPEALREAFEAAGIPGIVILNA